RRRVDHEQPERADRARQGKQHEVDVPERARFRRHAATGGERARRCGERRHQSCPWLCAFTGLAVRPFIDPMTLRTIGAAVSAPKPASSTTATTTYCGLSAGKKPANNDVSPLLATCAVPVLPATGTCENGNPLNAAAAVPPCDCTAPSKPASICAR